MKSQTHMSASQVEKTRKSQDGNPVQLARFNTPLLWLFRSSEFLIIFVSGLIDFTLARKLPVVSEASKSTELLKNVQTEYVVTHSVIDYWCDFIKYKDVNAREQLIWNAC